jgi:hypothetical protein
MQEARTRASAARRPRRCVFDSARSVAERHT